MIAIPRLLSRCAFLMLLGICVPASISAQERGNAPGRDSDVKDLSLTADQRSIYVGTYVSELPGGEQVTLRILEEKGALRLWASNPGESRRLFYQGDNVFLVENAPGFILTFVVLYNAALKITVHKPEGDLIAVRVAGI